MVLLLQQLEGVDHLTKLTQRFLSDSIGVAPRSIRSDLDFLKKFQLVKPGKNPEATIKFIALLEDIKRDYPTILAYEEDEEDED